MRQTEWAQDVTIPYYLLIQNVNLRLIKGIKK